MSAQTTLEARAAGADLHLELDTNPREMSVPTDFAAELAREPEAQRFFDRLSYSQRRWFVTGIEQAKVSATRERLIAMAVGMLCEGRAPR